MGWQVKISGLKTTPQQRYLDFLRDVLENRDIYGVMVNEVNWVAIESAYFFTEEHKLWHVIPFWSSTHRSCLDYCVDTKIGQFKVTSILGFEFAKKIVPDFTSKQVMLGFNWDRLLNGLEYNAEAFLSHLQQLRERGEIEFESQNFPINSGKFFGFDF